MSEDVVDLLLRGDIYGNCKADRCMCSIMEDGAEEIKRLRTENEKLQWELGKALDTLVVHDAVCAENEKLRAALKPFLIEHWPEHKVYGYKMVFVTPDDLRAAAAALNDKKNDNK